MTVQVAPRIPFHPAQCPGCLNFVEPIHRCRAYFTESFPRPLLAILSGESSESCPRYEKQISTASSASTPTASAEQAAQIDLSNPEKTLEATGSNGQAEMAPVAQVPMPEEKPVDIQINEMAASARLQPADKDTYHKAKIHCPRCKSENPPTAYHCQNCDANLLPGESIGQRVGMFFTLLLVAGGLAYLFYRFYIQDPGSAPDFVLCNQGALAGGGVVCFIMAFVLLIRKTPEYERYVNRANRHLKLNAWQSLEDLNHAMDLAPEKQHMSLVKQRAKVYETLGLSQEAARDHLSLATSPDAYKSEGDWVAALTGADANTFSSSMRSSQIKSMLSSGKVMAVGYCKQCQDVVELNSEQRCQVHAKNKGQEVELVIPADILAGRLAVMQKLEHRHAHLATQLTGLLESGEAVAIGYCTRCKAVVQLDSKRHCQLHPKVKGRRVQYAVPGQESQGKQAILRWRRGDQLNSRRRWLMVAGLILLAYAIVKYLIPGEVGQIFDNLLNGLR